MGTSHRHKVTGSPNWGKASSSITRIANAEMGLNQLETNPPENLSPQAIIKKRNQYIGRIERHYRNAIRNVVRAAGGRVAVSSGKSRAIGHAGVSWALAFTRSFQEIATQGLANWLSNKGILSLEGKTCQDIILLIIDFVDDYFAGFDDTAAREALEFVMKIVEQKVGDDPSKFDAVINGIIGTEEIKNLIDCFFGIYIFSHLAQDFMEKLAKDKGIEVADFTMREIKNLIIDDVQRGVNGREAGNVDWKGSEGESFIKAEFERIIKILTDNED